jgi:hypothetical protein
VKQYPKGFIAALGGELCKEFAVQTASLYVSRFRSTTLYRMGTGRWLDPKRQGFEALLRRAPKDPWLSRRLWRKYRQYRLPVDSVASRASNLPPHGLANAPARRILVYHEADKAGPHIEAYLEVKGVAYNIGVKRLSIEAQEELGLRYNREGWLTQDSQKTLIEFWRREFRLGKGAWLAQSTDHRPHEARMQWAGAENGVTGYGAGSLRQVLADDAVTVSTLGTAVEWIDPKIDRHRKAYAFKIMKEGEKRSVNILGVGLKENPKAPAFEKLSLKYDDDIEKFMRLVGEDGIYTIKYDGASVYFRITRDGTHFWSPRTSKVTGAHIMYDSKVRDWITVASDIPIEGQGEFLAYRNGQALSAAEIGGLLNGHDPIPPNIDIRLVVYRVDRLGRSTVLHEAYEGHEHHLSGVAALHQDWSPPERVPGSAGSIRAIAGTQEGVVGTPRGASLFDAGRKLKIRGDTQDWTVESVDLSQGENGGIAGVVWFVAENGRRYKVGGGPLGPMERREAMLKDPKAFEGRVYRVAWHKGHVGRAAHVLDEHVDKGEV